jgi:hypothetical protein
MFGNCMRRPLGEDYARDWPTASEHSAQQGEGPIVLFECPDGAEAHGVWKLLERYGYRMTWCPGPKGGFSEQCTLSATGHCPLVEQAAAVVSSLDLVDPLDQKVVRALDDKVATARPVVVVTTEGSVPRWTEELPGCRVVAGPLSSKVLVRSLSLAVPVGAGATAADS